MSVVHQAAEAAMMKYWNAETTDDGGLRMEIDVGENRTQVVTVTLATDGDGDAVAFIWSQAGDLRAAADPMALLRLNAQLSYGRVALRGDDVLVLYTLYDADATLSQVGKALYWVAKSADDVERQTYGDYSDTL